jgi:hypothetical protein
MPVLPATFLLMEFTLLTREQASARGLAVKNVLYLGARPPFPATLLGEEDPDKEIGGSMQAHDEEAAAWARAHHGIELPLRTDPFVMSDIIVTPKPESRGIFLVWSAGESPLPT